MMTQHTIFFKGLLLIAVPLVFQLIFLALVARMRSENFEAKSGAFHGTIVIAQAERCRLMILSAHDPIQDLYLTREPSFEKSFNR